MHVHGFSSKKGGLLGKVRAVEKRPPISADPREPQARPDRSHVGR